MRYSSNGWQFEMWKGNSNDMSEFDKLLDLLKQLLMYTNGDMQEALNWLTELDKAHDLTSDEYGMADFIEDLKQKSYLTSSKGLMHMTQKMEISLRRKALEDVFSEIKKAGRGFHQTNKSGKGDERTSDLRPYAFGDELDKMALTETLQNAQRNHGIDDLRIDQDDIMINETYHQSRMSTALLIDISHSMILYGEDRITPAKKVAMALGELITTRFTQDTLDIVTFGDDAQRIALEDIPYLEVGPFHTNTVAGLQLGMDLLRKRKNPNKQILMITDGKPSCIKKGDQYYKNSFGLDKQIVKRTLSMAHRCRKLNIPITTFMIARDEYLMQFIHQFTAVNNGRAFYSSLEDLGNFIFYDYKNKKRRG
jgi:uncharacterized protein with von Willebrand factor type A (vWA) domain